MSQATMDFRPPLASPLQMPPNPTSSQNASMDQKSKSRSDSGTNPTVGFDQGNARFGAFDSSFVLPPDMARSGPPGRSKPRLLKHRKKSGSERSNRVNNDGVSACNSDNAANEPSYRAGSVNCGYHVNFVFGAENSDSGFYSELNQGEFNGNVGHSGAGKFENSNSSFVFGSNKTAVADNSESVKELREGNEGKLETVQLGESIEKSGLSINLQQPEYCGSTKQSGGNKAWKANNAAFVFGDHKSCLYSNLTSNCGESNGRIGREFWKFSNGLAFGEQNSSFEKEKIQKSVQKLGRNKFEKLNSLEFNFNANKVDSVCYSNPENSEIGESTGEPVQKANTAFGFNRPIPGSVSNMSVFASNNAFSSSNLNVRNNGCGESFGKFNSVLQGKMKSDCENNGVLNMGTEKNSQKEMDNGVFVFQCGSRKGFVFNDRSCIDGKNSSNDGIPGSCQGFVAKQSNCVRSDFSDSHDFVFGSTINVAGSSSKIPVTNLSDEMSSLNINDSERINSDGVSGVRSRDEPERENDLSFDDDNALNLNGSTSHKVYLFPGLDKASELSSSRGSNRDRRSKKKNGKLRRQTLRKEFKQGHLAKDDNFQLNEEPSACGSPMDFSPYPDKNSATSTVNSHVFNGTKHEDFTALSEGSDTSEIQRKKEVPNDQDSSNCAESYGVSQHQLKESAPDPAVEYMSSRAEQGSIRPPSGMCSHTKNDERDCKPRTSASTTEEFEDNDTFIFSTPEKDSLLAIRRQYRKKYKSKVGGGSERSNSSAGKNAMKSPTEYDAQEVCNKWRLRGNQTYKDGNLSQAEELYTRGINSIQPAKIPSCCIEPIVLCYSNRAAARMSLGRIREALHDCAKAASLDVNFIKVHIRAANCHLVLGEVDFALKYFNKCLESGNTVCLDRRVTIEAADGLQKAQKVLVCQNEAAKVLEQRTSDAANAALELIAEARSFSCHSEKLFELKGAALCLLRKYEDAIQLCEQTVGFAEKNFSVVGSVNLLEDVNDPKHKNSSIWLWRWCMMSKAYYHLGKLEIALHVIEKLEDLQSTEYRYVDKESSILLAANIRELLRRKKEGNEAFLSGRHAEAIEHYTAAISSGIESHPFAAICFCNRAAAYQALGQFSDAIADCNIAIALDENYSKAVSRRASLHETIRNYEQAANDLLRLVSLLESKSQEKAAQLSKTTNGITESGLEDVNRARRRLSLMEEKAKKGFPFSLYMILGIKSSDTALVIKKAYRKAALRHHPDKAGQFLPRTETGDNGQLRKEIVAKVHIDADRLFKTIGEAYAILSDPTKRSKYELEEEMRNNKTDDYRGDSSRGQDDYCYPFDQN